MSVSTSNVQGLEAQECSDVACLSESVQLLASSVVQMQYALGVDDLEDIANLTNATADTATVVSWTLLTTFNILFMQTGFALLEAGIARANSVKAVLLKNLMDFGTTIIAWWLFGFAIATLDVDSIALSRRSGPEKLSLWLSSLSFCSTSVTIVSGGTLGRMEAYGYVLFSVYMSIVTYPILSYWAWHPDGFLENLGFLDFAGSGVVHVTGGLCAFVGAAVIGPRANRFRVTQDGVVTVRNFGKHSSSLTVTGVWILFFGWTGFNASRLNDGLVSDFYVSSLAASNTVIAFGAGLVAGIGISLARSEHNLTIIMNSILASLVAITSGCGYVDTWAAFVIGLLGAIVTHGYSILALRCRVDDPVDAFAVHAGAGSVGVVLTGIFACPELSPSEVPGLVYSGNFRGLGIQLLGLLVIVVWSSCTALVIFFFMRYATPTLLRTSASLEEAGLDLQFADGMGYPNFFIENAESKGTESSRTPDRAPSPSPEDKTSIEMVPVPSTTSNSTDSDETHSTEAMRGKSESSDLEPSSPRRRIAWLLTNAHTLSQVMSFLRIGEIHSMMLTCWRIRNFLADTNISMGFWAGLLQRDFSHKVLGAVTESTFAASRAQYKLFHTEKVVCRRNWQTGQPMSQGPLRFQMHIQEYAASSTNLVAVGSFDGTIRVGDVDTDAISEPLPDNHVNAVTALHVCDDNSTIISGSGLLPWMAHGANALQFRNSVKVWKLITGMPSVASRGEWKCCRTLDGHAGSVTQVGYFHCRPDSNLFASFRSRFQGNDLCWSATSEDEVYVWDVEAGIRRHTIKFEKQLSYCAVITRGVSRDDPPVLVCVCSSMEVLTIVFIDLIHGIVLSHSHIRQSALHTEPQMSVNGNRFILLQGAFMSYGEIIFTSSNITGSTKRAPPPLVGAASDASGGGGAAGAKRTSNFDQDQSCTVQTFTKDLLAARGAAVKATTAPSPRYLLPAVYVSQQCRVVIDDTPKCCFLDATGGRIVLVLQTGLLQVWGIEKGGTSLKKLWGFDTNTATVSNLRCTETCLLLNGFEDKIMRLRFGF